MERAVFFNGKFIPESEAKISALTPALLCGWGLFETMRSYNSRIVYLNAHLDRLQNSCNLMKLQFGFSFMELKKIIRRLIRINSLTDAKVRITLWRAECQTDILVTAKKYRPHLPDKYRKGFRTRIFSLRQNENYFFARLKLINRLFYETAYLEAKKKKFDEAIILNNRGYVTEASRSNIFLVKDNTLFSPALECGGLDGITRKVIFDLAKKNNINVEEGKFTLYNLYEADEAFLTNSLMGVMPLASIEKQPIGNAAAGKITQLLMKKYNNLLRKK